MQKEYHRFKSSFIKETKKDEIVKVAKNKRIRNLDILHNGSIGIVRIFEMLPTATKTLFWMTRERARERGWKFVWIGAGKILARKEEGHRIVTITKEADINQEMN